MSGFYTRTLYDECNNIEGLNISTGPGKWVISTPQQSDNPCFSAHGPRNTRTGNSSILPVEYSNSVEIESSLRGLDVPLSRCMAPNALLARDKILNERIKDAKKRNAGENCTSFLDVNHTRLEPPARITEKPYNRYGYPIIDPNEWNFYGFGDNTFSTTTEGNVRDGRSTRYDVKRTLDKKNAELRKSANKFQIVDAINSNLS